MKTGGPAPAVSVKMADWFSEEYLDALPVDQLRQLLDQVKDDVVVARIRQVLARKGG